MTAASIAPTTRPSSDVPRRLAQVLESNGIRPGDRIATLASNTFRHAECFYGVSGMGAVLHTVNPRLFREQIAYIIRHAEDRVLVFDADLRRSSNRLLPRSAVSNSSSCCASARSCRSRSTQLVAYEDWIAAGSDDYVWPEFDERSASSLCCTSALPGIRRACSTATARRCCTPTRGACRDALALSTPRHRAAGRADVPRQRLGPAVRAPMVGAKLVLPGPEAGRAESLYELLERARA
ncbi:MAG: AMP-binding protein [Comamonadaceae bacterium]|nr:AMP-binding protein [Comamonadaceae bacterium]